MLKRRGHVGRTSRALASFAAVALAACALDPSGKAEEEVDDAATTSAEASTSGPGPTSTQASSASSAAPSSGGGVGGEGLGAGGSGAGGESIEWSKRFLGNEQQSVTGVAVGRDGAWLYVAGFTGGDVLAIEGDDTLAAVNEVDAFVVKVSIDGSVVDWIQVFGGAGDDQARAIAVGLDELGVERIYVGGLGRGVDGPGDAFAGLTPPTEDFGWMVALSPDDGAAEGGVAWGPVAPADGIDIEATDGNGAAALSTCIGCLGGTDADIVLAGLREADDSWHALALVAPGEQRGRALSFDATSSRWAFAGELGDGELDANVQGVEEPACRLTAQGGRDGFVALYDAVGEELHCAGAQVLGSAGDDVVRAVLAVGQEAVVAMEAAEDWDEGVAGPVVVRLSASGLGWSFELAPGVAGSEVRGLALRGDQLVAVGREGGAAYVQRLDLGDGADVARRNAALGDSQINTVTADGVSWLVGGRHEGMVDLDGELVLESSTSVDGFAARLVDP